MTISKIIAFMNAYSQGKSGGDMVFIEIAKRIKNYDKVIITSLLGRKLCEDNGVGGEYLITSSEKEFKNIIFTYIKRTIKALFLKITLKKDDVLLGTSDFLPDVLPIFFLKIRNKNTKWIQHIFHLIPSSRKIPFLAQKLSLFLIKLKADWVVVDNGLLKKDLEKLGFKPEKIVVNYPGINHNFLKTIKTGKEKLYDGVFMAQLRVSKGIYDLIKIWQLVCRRLPEAKLGIIGRGQEGIKEKLEEEIKKFGLEKNIYLLGYLEDRKAFGVIKASKIFVFPSHEEGFGIAPLEAQALGLPVVAWDLPIFEEIFPKGMIKLKMGKVEEFAERIVKLLKDQGLYQKVSFEAKENSARYNWEKTAKRELRLLVEK